MVNVVKAHRRTGVRMPGQERGNAALRAAIAAAGMTHQQLARAVVRVAAESDAPELTTVTRSHVSHWVAGTVPSGRGPQVLAETLSRHLPRPVLPQDIGLPAGGGIESLSWSADTLAALVDLGRADVDLQRRQVLGAAAYSLAALALPAEDWWPQMARTGRRAVGGGPRVGAGDVEAVQDMVRLFSQVDQRRGGGHARTAVIHYLSGDVARLLRGRTGNEHLRRELFTSAAELAYLAGWMAFDDAEHAAAQRHFTVAIQLAAEADDPPMQAHVLRAMAHQAVELGHPRQAVTLADASVAGDRYTLASPRERALLGVVHGRALAAARQPRRAARALLRAESDLAAAGPGDDEPGRVGFFGAASLAHETACTLRDSGDLAGAADQFRLSVRTRRATTFTRTHAVTLGYLGEVQARAGEIETACTTWIRALDAMDGVRSGRTRAVARTMRVLLSPYRDRQVRGARTVDARAKQYLDAA